MVHRSMRASSDGHVLDKLSLKEDTVEDKQPIQPPDMMRNSLRGFAWSIFISGVLPWLIYRVLRNNFGVSELVALVVSGIPPFLDTIVGIIRFRRVDLIAGISLLSIVVGLAVLALGGSPRLYLIRESFFTAAIGLAFLVSMLFQKSLLYYAARQVMTGNTPEGIAKFEARWREDAQFRQRFQVRLRPFGFLWGFGLLFEAVVRTYLVYTLSTEQFLVVSPFVLYGITFGLIAIQIWLIRRIRKEREAQARVQEAS